MSVFYPDGFLPLAAAASNVVTGDNPVFTKDDFLAFYPQFTDNISDDILTEFITMADSVVKEARWHIQWKLGMVLFIAHFAALYLQTLSGGNPTADTVVSSAQAKGLMTSKSAGDVSVSYDYSTLAADLSGWAMFNATQYGMQYATLAKSMVKGGMYIY